MNEKWNAENPALTTILSEMALPGYPEEIYAIATRDIPELINKLHGEFKKDGETA